MSFSITTKLFKNDCRRYKDKRLIRLEFTTKFVTVRGPKLCLHVIFHANRSKNDHVGRCDHQKGVPWPIVQRGFRAGWSIFGRADGKQDAGAKLHHHYFHFRTSSSALSVGRYRDLTFIEAVIWIERFRPHHGNQAVNGFLETTTHAEQSNRRLKNDVTIFFPSVSERTYVAPSQNVRSFITSKFI